MNVKFLAGEIFGTSRSKFLQPSFHDPYLAAQNCLWRNTREQVWLTNHMRRVEAVWCSQERSNSWQRSEVSMGSPDFDKVHLRQTSVQQCFSQRRQGKEPISIYFDNKQIVILLVSEIILGMRDLPTKTFKQDLKAFWWKNKCKKWPIGLPLDLTNSQSRTCRIVSRFEVKRLKMASGGVLVTLDCEIRWRDLSEEVRYKVDGW